MKSIRALSAYYYVGLIIGYFSKEDVIIWADRMIEGNESFPYELIDVSLSNNKSLEDVASKLKKAYGEETIREPLYQLIGELVSEIETGNISDDEFFSYILSLYRQGSAFSLDEDLSHVLDRLSDGYYLATQGIYGDVNSIRIEAINQLNNFKNYVGRFNEV